METLRGTVKDLRARMMRPEVQVPLSERIDKLPKWRKDWLEVWGNQWAPTKAPMACERCVYASGEHADFCELKQASPIMRLIKETGREF